MEEVNNEKIDILNIHYYLNDGTHQLDAFIHNDCEKAFLNIAKEVASKFGVKIEVKAFAKKEGGLQDFFQLAASTTSTWLPIMTSLCILIIGKLIPQKHKDKLDKEEQKIRIERAKVELEQIKNAAIAEQKDKNSKSTIDIEKVINYLLDENLKIKKQQSNFFAKIMQVPHISQIDINLKSSKEPEFVKTYSILREEFESYILQTDTLKSEIDNNAEIEIISPVLRTQGRYSWKGIYAKTNEIIDFKMGDKDFKKEIEDDGISFQHGTFLSCELEIQRKLNEDGEIVISGYKVLTVYQHRIGDSIKITNNRKKKTENFQIEYPVLPFEEF